MVEYSLTALFDSVATAREATDSLIQAGVSSDDIAVATRHTGTETVFGSASSLLPGQGPFSWNPYANILPEAAAGAYAQAFVTTVPEDEAASLFEGQGLAPEAAADCAAALQRGGAVLIIRPSDDSVPRERIARTLESFGARTIA